MMKDSHELLITGASGFIGSSLVLHAQKSGWRVRTLCRTHQANFEEVQQFVGDVCDVSLVKKACAGATAVVHAAGLAHVFDSTAKDPSCFETVNVAGTANVAKAADENNVTHLVLVSSVSVYGNRNGSICDETTDCKPESAYAVSKRQAELKAVDQFRSGRGALTILRLATVYGEGDRGNVARLIRAIERGRFVWPGSGKNKKSLIYKQDAARACLLAVERPAPGVRIFNVSSEPASMREIVTAICQALECPIPLLRVPLSLVEAVGVLSRAIGDTGQLAQRLQKFVHEDVFDGTKFASEFGFCPAVSLAEGMRREVESLRGRR